MYPEIYCTEEFETLYTYDGPLGADWSPERTVFRLWAPTAIGVKVNLYSDGSSSGIVQAVQLQPAAQGVWEGRLSGDLQGLYYTYEVAVDGKVCELCDPYAVATGVNGHRAMILDLSATDPDGWAADRDPHYGAPITDAVLYELHLRDLSMDSHSGIRHKGKFLGLTETGTRSPAGLPTGLDHIKALGVTHVHLLPVFDFGSVDEANPSYNWGYDPMNYNTPEGSYATDPHDGAVRVREMKAMVKALHDAGLSVVMDVVYNHVYHRERFCINRAVPGYFSRIDRWGNWSDGCGCGNDTATERSMVRRYIADSVKYWADEYHIDGFRFDLMGLMDTRCINTVVETVRADHPNVIFYGEGWNMPTRVTKPGFAMANQDNSVLIPDVACFNDTLRDTLRGPMFDDRAQGFATGGHGYDERLRDSFFGSPHWCKNPTQTVNYAACHDNLALFDRITLCTPGWSRQQRAAANRLCAAVVLLSQGIPLLHAGEELLRSRPLPGGGFEHNAYKSPDSVNAIRWQLLSDPESARTLAYYKGLIALRKAHPTLRLQTAAQVRRHVTAVQGLAPNTAAFVLEPVEGDRPLCILLNGTAHSQPMPLPAGVWQMLADGDRAGTAPFARAKHQATLAPFSAMVLVRE